MSGELDKTMTVRMDEYLWEWLRGHDYMSASQYARYLLEAARSKDLSESE